MNSVLGFFNFIFRIFNTNKTFIETQFSFTSNYIFNNVSFLFLRTRILRQPLPRMILKPTLAQTKQLWWTTQIHFRLDRTGDSPSNHRYVITLLHNEYFHHLISIFIDYYNYQNHIFSFQVEALTRFCLRHITLSKGINVDSFQIENLLLINTLITVVFEIFWYKS